MEEGARRRRRRRRRTELLGPDLISALPEDLLLLVLVRLRCARAAARTSLLSRRWRFLWTRIPDLIFRDVPVPSIQAVLSSLHGAVDPGVSLLDIAFTSIQFANGLDGGLAAGVPSLLRAAAGVSPVEFHLSLPHNLERPLAGGVELPRFHRATSIHLYAPKLCLTLPPSSGGFPALERLSLRGCRVDLATLVLGCPCLRLLRVTDASLGAAGINIQSESLQKLFVRTDRNYRWTDCINVEAPMLQQLTVSFDAGGELSVSVVAPILEKVSWECSYSNDRMAAGFAPWRLSKVRLYAADSLRQRVITGAGEDTCLQLSNVHVLSLQMTARGLFDAELNFVQQIEKHLVTDFSVLELTMEYDSVGHVFGPFVLRLLGAHRIRTATRRLQIHVLRSQVKEECPVNCPCDEPKNWRSKNISLINLEEVEIDGFVWEDHEFDFLKVIFRCAPMLRRMTVSTSYKIPTINDWCTKLYDIFKAYPSVECKLMQQ